MKKRIAVLVALLMLVSLALCGCGRDGGAVASPAPTEEAVNGSIDMGGDDITTGQDDPDEPNVQDPATSSQGDPVPTFTEDWPADALPEGFPNLGKVTRVMDFRTYGNEIYISWNIVSEEEVQNIVDTLNEYLDYDIAWQGYFYSDGVKYKEGTEEELLKIEVRYDASASGEAGENFEPQLTIEISGEGLPAED